MDMALKDMEVAANRAAQAHMGRVAWPTVLLGSVCVVGYAATLWLVASNVLPLAAAFALIAVLVYASYTIVHEAVHGSINGKNRSLSWLNDAMGYLCAQLFGVAFTVHRKEHLAHHRHTNLPGEDPDLMLVRGGPAGLIRGAIIALPMQIRYYAQRHWKTAGVRERCILFAEYTLMIAWRAGFIIAAGWQTALLLLVLATLAGVLMLLTGFAWIVHRSFDARGRYKDTSTIIFAEPYDTVLTGLWLFQNYHSIHHLFPRVPFYRYRRLFGEIEDVMRANGAPIFYIGKGAPIAGLPSIEPGAHATSH